MSASPLVEPTRNVADLVRAAAARRPAAAALIAAAGPLTWGELDGRVDRFAAGLRGLGLQPGDRVAVQLGNVPEFAVAWFGALRAGAVAVPTNPHLAAPEVAHVLSDSGARVLVTARRDPVDGPEHVLRTGEELDAFLEAAPGGPVEAVTGGEDLAAILYTSGTTGRPRGAMLPHRALLANLAQLDRIDPPVAAEDDVVLLVMPLFHVYGLNTALGLVARHAATGVLVERFDPVDTLDQVRRHGVTSIVAAPPVYVAWSLLPDVGDAFSHVRLALSGAAPLPRDVLHRVLDVTGHHVFEGYGLTETAPVLTATLMSEVPKPDSVGRPIPGVELRLLDESGGDVEDGDPGEVVVRGPNLFQGYWPDAQGGPDAEGWWATGDVAVVDHDGDLHLVDRRRELILVSGFNVYPREVEEVLLGHPGVREAAVLGIPHPYTGQAVKAVVVARDGARLTAEELIAHCARGLARFKCPTAVEVVPSLPHSATGKVSKGRLREQQ